MLSGREASEDASGVLPEEASADVSGVLPEEASADASDVSPQEDHEGVSPKESAGSCSSGASGGMYWSRILARNTDLQ